MFAALGKVVKAAREAAGMTQAQLHAALGLAPQESGGSAFVSKLESGKHDPTHERLSAVAKATGRAIVVTYLPTGEVGAKLKEMG